MYTPRSLADSTAIRVFPINETVILTECLLIICLVPINMNFVFSGFINKSFVQHQVPTLRKSSSSLNLASMTSATGKDSKTFESSTYDSSWQNLGAPGRSFR